MLVADYDYDLPGALIARYPASERCASRLLEVGENLIDRQFADLPLVLRAGDLLVFNNTRVIRARLTAKKETGGRVEILIERIQGDRDALVHLRASKSPRPGMRVLLQGGVEATVGGRDGDLYLLRFSTSVDTILDQLGEVPLPPYLRRRAERIDAERYQTVYAKDPGAVAAPTAGLHFDNRMLEATLTAGIRHAFLTLHVGAGTFQALRSERVESNRLHYERVQVGERCCELVRDTRRSGGRVIAVGTTAVRSLESASAGGSIEPFDGETDLFIFPGYRFRSVDAMITNFHLPRSSLLMLVAAFAGTDRILEAYRHAVSREYRFFSYGDSMFVTPGERQ